MAFKWDETKEQAAMLCAIGELGSEEIITKCGIARSTYFEWQKSEEFKSRVDQNLAEIRERLMSSGIANILNRLKRYDKRWNQIDQLINERGADPIHAKVPGYSTGLLAADKKSIGGGENAYTVDVYRADTALIKEERELAKQAAQDLGQWTEKTDVTSGGKPILVIDV